MKSITEIAQENLLSTKGDIRFLAGKLRHEYKKLEPTKEKKEFVELPELIARSQREDLINQIVEATTEKDKKKLARVLAIAANTFKWSNTDLHALLKKQGEVRNFTAFVWWSCKSRKV